MKLVRQSRLHFREGKSDKVYEVDLCDAGDDGFVVNFRYGRRNSTLKEGTKTPFPESRAKAERIFAELIAEKTRKGYLIEGEAGLPAEAPTVAAAIVAAVPAIADPRRIAILRRLEEALATTSSPKPKRGRPPWRLSRVIWRAGAWKMTEAADAIAALSVRLTQPMDLWCAAWALGRCGAARHAVALEAMAARSGDPSWVRAILAEAQQALAPAEDDAALIRQLPAAVAAVFQSGDPRAFRTVVEQELRSGLHPELPAALMLLAARHRRVRETLHEMVRLLPIRRGTMPFFRQVLKAAEFRLDAELYGQVVRRFDLSAATGRRPTKEVPQPAYTAATRHYLRRRPVRTLKIAGDSGEPSLFIPLATGLLLAYDDEIDLPAESWTTKYEWDRTSRRHIQTRIWYPRYHTGHSFLWLLRGAGQALELTYGKVAWRFKTGERGDATSREEPYPGLWDQAPDAVMHLLRHARTGEVQRFALRIWRANPSFIGEADASFIGDLLASWFAETTALGLEIARARWNPAEPDRPLLLALLDSPLAAAREFGIAGLQACSTRLTGDAVFLSAAAFLSYEDSRLALRDILRTATIFTEVRRDLVARIVSGLLALDSDESAKAGIAVDFLQLVAPHELQELPAEHLAELAAHPLEDCQVLAVRILLERPSLTGLPDGVLLAAVSSEFKSVRRLGMRLLARLSDYELASRTEAVAACAVSKHPELREGAVPLLARVAKSRREAARELVLQWYPLLFREEAFEGLHASVYQLLVGPFAEEIEVIPADSIPRMLESRHDHGQMLGFELLKREVGPFAGEDLVAWAVHPLAALRDWALDRLEAQPEILRQNPGLTLRLLESPFDASRARAFDFCRREIREGDWTPEAIVTVCDSNQQAARDFGRELVTRLFREQDGPLYLACFSQHPATEIQLFATNYLERFASGSAGRIAGLDLYFRTVLSRIGAGRVAKRRVLAFLEKEALGSEEIARGVIPLLARQSGTVAIQDKAGMIRILDALRRRWPDLDSPLKPRPVPIHPPA